MFFLELVFNENYWTSDPISTLQILYALPTLQNGGQNRYKAYYSKYTKIWFGFLYM